MAITESYCLIVNVCDEYQGKGRNFGGTDSDFINGLQIPVGLDRPNEAKPWKILSQSLIYIFELKTLDLYYLQIFGSGDGPYQLGLCNPGSLGLLRHNFMDRAWC